jgi:hypothetical protein
MTNYYDLDYDYDVGVAPYFNFPRALYPPDHPEGPSKDGPDVEAYKTIAWYFGRWATVDGKPQSNPGFDRAYSNAFAHGKTANVGDSGIEGIQRQANVAGASGVLGQRTFDILIYSRIPDGLPNAGKFPLSINKYIGELLEEAYQRFHEEPEEEPSPSGSPRQKAMDHQEKRVGYTEYPAGSNCDSRSDGIRTSQDHTAGGGTWLRYQPWCGCWCYYALETAGVAGIDSHLASVASIEDRARSGAAPYRGWTTSRSSIKKGDLVIVGGYGVHVEMVRGAAYSDGGVPTYGGNTSPGTSGSQSNGGGAFRRVRYPSEVRGFALVRYPGE